MRILLVAIHAYPSPQAVPLANAFLLSYQAACMPADSAMEVILKDFFAGQSAAACVAELLALQPGAIGLSMYAWNRLLCLEIASEVARCLPEVTLFAGGPEATADPEGVMAAAPFTFLISGEGEEPFAGVCSRLAAGKGFSGIPGVVVRGEQSPLPTQQPLPVDLDHIPSPYLTGILDTRSYRGILWQLSRGCGFACDFCFDARGSRAVRRFSLQRVEEELRHFAAMEVSQVFVLDSTFNQDARRAKSVLKLIRKIAPRIHFHFEVRSEFIDAEMARLFARITCSLQIGLQSCDPQVLKGVGRLFDRKAFVNKIGLLNESGAAFGFDLMYGLPGDTLHGFSESLDFALGLYPNHLDIFPLAVLPGTALAARSRGLGLNCLPDPPYTLLSSPAFSAGEMALAGMLAAACDIFYTRGKAVAWFNGVLAPLGLKPSCFLRMFGERLAAGQGRVASEADLDDNEIWLMQRGFLTEMYKQKGVRQLIPLVLDLVDYHHHYAACLMAPLPEIPGNSILRRLRLPETAFRLAPAARLAVFHYEILDILEAGAPDIRAFARHFPATGSWAAIYPGADGVCTESLAEPFYCLLEQLDGSTPAGLIAARLGIPLDETRSFLEFAAAEGIIELPAR